MMSSFISGSNIPGGLHNYLNTGRVLVCDNYFTYPKVIEYLLEFDTYYIGTLKHRNKVPSEMSNCYKYDANWEIEMEEVTNRNGKTTKRKVPMERGNNVIDRYVIYVRTLIDRYVIYYM